MIETVLKMLIYIFSHKNEIFKTFYDIFKYLLCKFTPAVHQHDAILDKTKNKK